MPSVQNCSRFAFRLVLSTLATMSTAQSGFNPHYAVNLLGRFGRHCGKIPGGSGVPLATTIIGWQGITEDNLNLDSSVLFRYGRQQGARRGYNPKKRGRPSRHPLLAFLGSGYVVNLWNRSGDTGAGQGAVRFFCQTLKVPGEDFRINRVLCNSGFYDVELIEQLESDGFTYIISVPMSLTIQREIFRGARWRAISKGIEAGDFVFEHRDPK